VVAIHSGRLVVEPSSSDRRPATFCLSGKGVSSTIGTDVNGCCSRMLVEIWAESVRAREEIAGLMLDVQKPIPPP
jgi:hypothetical protein